MNKILQFLMTAVFIGLSMQAMAQKEYVNDNRVLMVVGNVPVTVAEFMNVYTKNNQVENVIDQKTLDEYVKMYAEFKFKVCEAEEQKLDTSSGFEKELQGYRKDLSKPYFVDDSVIKLLVKEAYQRMQEDIRASHILIFCNPDSAPKDTLEAYKKIEKIRNRIQKGADFSTVAVETSEDPSARDQEAKNGQPSAKGNKGDLGYFTVFNMVYPFETGAYNTPKNSLSPIVRSSFGYHLINITDRQPAMGQTQVAHIFFQIKQGYTKAQEDSLLQRANDVYAQLQKSGQWETLVRQYSDDKATSMHNGVLPWFSVNRMVSEFIVAVRNLKEIGDFSAPVKTDYGYHIIRLEARKPIPAFVDAEKDIKAKVLRDSRSELSTEAIIEKIKQEYTFTTYPENLKTFQKEFGTSLLSNEWNEEAVAKSRLPLFNIGDSILLSGQFAKYVEEQQKTEKQSAETPETEESITHKYFKMWIDNTCLAYEDHRLEQKHSEFRLILNEYREGILLYEMINKEVWEKSTTDTSGLENFFAQNRNKYMWDERRDYIELTASRFATEKDAQKAQKEIEKMLAKNKTDEEIKEKFADNEAINIIIIRKKVEKGVNEKIDNLWNQPAPYLESNETDLTLSIFRINAALKPEPKELSEVKGLAIIDYQEYLEKQWMKKLYEKYPVKINQEVLNTLR